MAPRDSRSLLDRPVVVLTAVTTAVALPLVVALAILHGQRWYPVLDLAMTELRVRDVGTSHTPLIGLPGRIGEYPHQGSHPGPLSFYLVALFYRVVGSSSWGLLVGAVAVHVAAIATALWIGHRRAGWRGMLVVSGVVVVMIRAYGQVLLTQPWNPYLPLMAWIVVVCAVWAVVAGDAMMLIPAVAAGSLCAQTHVPYLLLCVGLGALAFGVTLWRRRWRPAIIAGIVGVVLWFPAVLDQIVHRPGNVRILVDHFATPPEPAIGFGDGLRLALRNLDAATLLGGDVAGPGGFVSAASQSRGAVVLVVWAVAAVWGIGWGSTSLRSLHVTVGAALALGLASMARIFGTPWYYLTLWAWTTTAFVLVSIAWSAWQGIRSFAAGRARVTTLLAGGRGRMAAGGIATLVTVVGIVNLVEFASPDNPEERLSAAVGNLAGQTFDAIVAGAGRADGLDSTYVVRWSDAADIGSPGYGLFDELERRGADVIADEFFRVPMTDHRVGLRSTAVAQIQLATGGNVAIWRRVPGAVEVATYDPRDDAERAEYADRRTSIIGRLRSEGLDDLAPLVDTNLFGLALDPRLSAADQADVTRLLDLGQPMSVFIAPAPDDDDPAAL